MGDPLPPRTKVCGNARWELLRCLAMIRDEFPKYHLDGQMFVPLYEGEWQNEAEDIWLAAREAGALGDIEFHPITASDPGTRMILNMRGGRDAMVRLTDQGYSVVKAHDAIGEAEQEPARPTAEGPRDGE